LYNCTKPSLTATDALLPSSMTGLVAVTNGAGRAATGGCNQRGHDGQRQRVAMSEALH
jgi:hypothetical protein